MSALPNSNPYRAARAGGTGSAPGVSGMNRAAPGVAPIGDGSSEGASLAALGQALNGAVNLTAEVGGYVAARRRQDEMRQREIEASAEAAARDAERRADRMENAAYRDEVRREREQSRIEARARNEAINNWATGQIDLEKRIATGAIPVDPNVDPVAFAEQFVAASYQKGSDAFTVAYNEAYRQRAVPDLARTIANLQVRKINEVKKDTIDKISTRIASNDPQAVEDAKALGLTTQEIDSALANAARASAIAGDPTRTSALLDQMSAVDAETRERLSATALSSQRSRQREEASAFEQEFDAATLKAATPDDLTVLVAQGLSSGRIDASDAARYTDKITKWRADENKRVAAYVENVEFQAAMDQVAVAVVDSRFRPTFEDVTTPTGRNISASDQRDALKLAIRSRTGVAPENIAAAPNDALARYVRAMSDAGILDQQVSAQVARLDFMGDMQVTPEEVRRVDLFRRLYAANPDYATQLLGGASENTRTAMLAMTTGGYFNGVATSADAILRAKRDTLDGVNTKEVSAQIAGLARAAAPNVPETIVQQISMAARPGWSSTQDKAGHVGAIARQLSFKSMELRSGWFDGRATTIDLGVLATDNTDTREAMAKAFSELVKKRVAEAKAANPFLKADDDDFTLALAPGPSRDTWRLQVLTDVLPLPESGATIRADEVRELASDIVDNKLGLNRKVRSVAEIEADIAKQPPQPPDSVLTPRGPLPVGYLYDLFNDRSGKDLLRELRAAKARELLEAK